MANFLPIVNSENKFDESMTNGLELIPIKDNQGNEVFADKTAYEALQKLMEELKEYNISASINAAGRTPEEQEELYNEIKNAKGERYASSHVAKPYESEHHLGLAFDIKLERITPTVIGKIPKVRAVDKMLMYNTMRRLMIKHGFIQRYTMLNKHKTGVSHERWHVRFVGPENSNKVKKAGSLEKFMEQFKPSDDISYEA